VLVNFIVICMEFAIAVFYFEDFTILELAVINYSFRIKVIYEILSIAVKLIN